MPIRKDLYEQMIAERTNAEASARRSDLRRWLLVLAVCLVWQLAGAALVVFAFHTTMEKDDALELVWGGLGIAAAGTILTIGLMAPKREREG